MVAFWALQFHIFGQLISGDNAISSYPTFLTKLRALHHTPITPLEADPLIDPDTDTDLTNGSSSVPQPEDQPPRRVSRPRWKRPNRTSEFALLNLLP